MLIVAVVAFPLCMVVVEVMVVRMVQGPRDLGKYKSGERLLEKLAIS